jgi:hypothetical protein
MCAVPYARSYKGAFSEHFIRLEFLFRAADKNAISSGSILSRASLTISEIMSTGGEAPLAYLYLNLCQLCILKVWIWQSFRDEHVRRDKPDVRSTAWKLQHFWFYQFILKFTWYVPFYQHEFMLSSNLSVVDKIPPAGNISSTGT